MKICTKCKQEKPYSEFYKNKLCKDGYNFWCKDCLKPEIKRNKQKEEYRQKQAEYSQKPEVRDRLNAKRRERWAENPEKYRQKHLRYVSKVLEKTPEKIRAREYIKHQMEYHNFPKATNFKCKYCDKQAQEYHHPSYAKDDWLKVEPVCKICHARIHKELRDASRIESPFSEGNLRKNT